MQDLKLLIASLLNELSAMLTRDVVEVEPIRWELKAPEAPTSEPTAPQFAYVPAHNRQRPALAYWRAYRQYVKGEPGIETERFRAQRQQLKPVRFHQY